jgi:hypothetical protein
MLLTLRFLRTHRQNRNVELLTKGFLIGLICDSLQL